MSNLWFNIRLGRWFFQSGPDKWLDIKRAQDGIIYDEVVRIYCAFGRHL